ncbi:MAG: Wzz/FepE/Etk N-terminal domain-containing protein [Deferribacterales bacterium]
MKKDNKESYRSLEINLLELFLMIWKRKMLIAAFVAVSTLCSVFAAYRMDNIYLSYFILKPTETQENSLLNLNAFSSVVGEVFGGGKRNIFHNMTAMIRNAEFVGKMIKENELEAYVVEDYDKIKNTEFFKENYNSIVQKSASKIFSINQDLNTSFITISVYHKDRVFAEKFCRIILKSISSGLENSEFKSIDEKIENFKNEINLTYDITLKNKLSDIIAGLIQSKVLAKAQGYYGVTVVSEPYVADPANRVKPDRVGIVTAVFAASFFIAVAGIIVFSVVAKILEEYRRERKDSAENSIGN